MKKRLTILFAAKAAILSIAPVHGELAVYEGFDYTAGDVLDGMGTAVDGWDGAWTGGNWNAIPGQSLGTLEVSGGAVQRPARNGNAATFRDISEASRTTLTGDGSTIWFSVLLQATGSPATEGGAAGFALNSWGTIVLGDAALTGGSGTAAAPIAGGGNAIGVGFAGTGGGGDYGNVRVQGVTYSSGVVTQNDAQRLTVGDATVMIVGRIDWAANGSDDVLNLFHVTEPTAALPAAFATMNVDLDQSTFDIISIGDAQTSICDEIRFGTELSDVVPADATAPTIAASTDFISVGDSVDLDITFDPTADIATLTTQGSTIDLIALDDGTNGDPVADDGEVAYTDSPTSTYTYVVDTTKTGETPKSTSVEVKVADPSTVPSNAFSTAILADMPLFYYRFEEAADTGFLIDSSGNGHHTADIAGNLTQGGSPGGMQLAGRCELTAAIEVPAASEMSESFTLTTVINADSVSGALLRNLFAMADDGNGGIGRSIFYYGSGGFESFISGNPPIDISDADALPAGMSCLIHLVFDADPDEDPLTDDQEFRLFVNGQPYGTPVAVGVVAANLGNWVLCSNKNLGTQSQVGWIDETAVFESVLSDVQIAAHGTAFFAAADPLLGFASAASEITIGDPVTLNWKISDQVTAVEIDGVAQTISGPGLYSTEFSPTEDTTYTIEVFYSGDSVTRSVDVTVVEPPLPPMITSISADTAVPPMVTIEVMGGANTSYEIRASADLLDGFTTPVGSVTTDEAGYGTTTFMGLGPAEFYRLEFP